MKLNEVTFTGRPPIDGYGPGVFTIGGYAHKGGLLILPSRVAQWTPAEPMTPDCFAAVIAAADEIDILLVGMGGAIAPLPRAARAAIEAADIGVDAMATDAACRTFNVLLVEDRRVGAALIAV